MPFETLTPPPWAAVVGTDPGGWTEAEQPPFAEQRPLAGSEWIISVATPRRAVEGDVFWALFSPALSALNGPDEHPDELDAMAMVACAPLAILAKDGKHTQLRGRVQDVVGVEDAPRRFSPSAGGSFDYLLGAGGQTVLTASPTSDLLYYSYNFEGDCGSWAVCKDTGTSRTVVLYGEWVFHMDYGAMGNRPLTAEEVSMFDQRYGRPPR
jgi:hypothetical protein